MEDKIMAICLGIASIGLFGALLLIYVTRYKEPHVED